MNQAGARAEDLCAELLRRYGLRIIERNWRCRHGEIDLIAEERGTLVFAEVRMRSRDGFGGAAESVTEAKRARLLAGEPDNPYDPNAVSVSWRGRKLGYVPQRDNRALASGLDRGERLQARISRLAEHPNPARRVEFEVFIE